MSKEILFSIADNENESTPLFDRVERKELRAALIKYPNFRVPMPSPRKGKWEDDTAYKAYENKLVGWKQLFAHHQREVEQKLLLMQRSYRLAVCRMVLVQFTLKTKKQ